MAESKYTLVGIDVHPDHDGDSVSRSMKVSETHKLDLTLAIPRNDDEAQRLYNMSLVDLLKKGVVQRSYDRDTSLGKLFETGDLTIDQPEKVATTLATDLATAAARVDRSWTPEQKAAARAKKEQEKAAANGMKEFAQSLGMDLDEMIRLQKEGKLKISAKK